MTENSTTSKSPITINALIFILAAALSCALLLTGCDSSSSSYDSEEESDYGEVMTDGELMEELSHYYYDDEGHIQDDRDW